MTAAPAPRPSSSEKLSGIIDALDITPFQKEVLRQRWLDQVTWMGRQARSARRRHNLIRVPTIVGGVLVPGLISILLAAGDSPTIDWLGGIPTATIRVLAFVVSLMVAILAATEDALRYADRWRHYRRTAELLKTLGWQYLSLNGAFKRYPSHADAFGAFSERVEDALNEDVEGYLSAVSAEGGDTRRDLVV